MNSERTEPGGSSPSLEYDAVTFRAELKAEYEV